MPPDIEEGLPFDDEAFHPVSVLWRRRRIVVTAVLVVAAAGLAASFLQTPVYSSTAAVLVEPPQQGTVPVAPNMDNEKKLVASTSVAQAVLDADRLKPDTETLLAGLSVSVPLNTSILDITYTDPGPSEARRGAQGFAQAYLAFRKEQLLRTTQATKSSVDALIAKVNQDLSRVRKRIAVAKPGSQGQTLLITRATSLQTELTQLEQRVQALPPLDALSVGEVVQRAAFPSSPSSPNRALDTVLGIMLGLMLGLGLALVVDRLDDRVRSAEEVGEILGVRVLGSVPPPARPPGSTPGSGARADPMVIEAFRSLRADFQFAVSERSAKSILITSCRPEDGKTLTIASLGEVLASAGQSVVLISADLRAPRLEGMFDQDPTPGLADVLSGDVALADAVREVAKGVRLLPAGSSTLDPVQLLSSREMSSVVRDLARSADLVLIDTPPLLSVADARVIVPSCDGVLFVADATSTTHAELREARGQLAWMKANVVGAVVLNVHVKAREYPYDPDRRREIPANEVANVSS